MSLSDAAGHRDRLRQRYLSAGFNSLADHEKLELLLTFAVPRSDTKPIARSLLKRFKSIGAILNAAPEALREIEGVGPASVACIHLVRDLTVHSLSERIDRGSVITQRQDVNAYLRLAYGQHAEEWVAVLFLDTSRHIIADQLMTQGTVNQCAVYPRAIIEKAISLKATAIILCHNHPGGAVQPSEEDWKITARLHEIGRLMDIPLLDHILLTRETAVSMREMTRWPQ